MGKLTLGGFPRQYSAIKLFVAISFFLCATASIYAQKVDYSVVSVPEETGLNFIRITNANDHVCMPMVERTNYGFNWLSNRIIDISHDGKKLAYLSFRNNTTNIFIKSLDVQGSSIQRTNRSSILDFSYSPDGKLICFSEASGSNNNIYQTDAESGYVCRQITSGNKDYTPIYSSDMQQIFFSRQEASSISIWSHNLKNNFLSSYSSGMNPCPIPNSNAILCTRINSAGRGEIWKIDYKTGIEECIVSDSKRSFTSPAISPNGRWILFVGSSFLQGPNFEYANTDIFVCTVDGLHFTQVTYHAADDISPVWSRDGKNIYFISQRGNSDAVANVWRIDFQY